MRGVLGRVRHYPGVHFPPLLDASTDWSISSGGWAGGFKKAVAAKHETHPFLSAPLLQFAKNIRSTLKASKPFANVTRHALRCTPQGKRNRGRPKTTWRRSTEAEVQQTGMSWNQLEKVAKDRGRWRSLLDDLCSTGA
ncbi:hypothetical protein ACROYT_G043641 [Oculina patagonica]